METLKAGVSASVSKSVSAEMTASAVGSGSVAVLASPALAALLEQAAVSALAPHLPPGKTTVGTRLHFSHLAPTPPGMRVTATATVTAVNQREITFSVSAEDEVEVIAQGTHTRFVVDEARFSAKTQAKLNRL